MHQTNLCHATWFLIVQKQLAGFPRLQAQDAIQCQVSYPYVIQRLKTISRLVGLKVKFQIYRAPLQGIGIWYVKMIIDIWYVKIGIPASLLRFIIAASTY
jgi:hypothetical protein